MDEIALSVERFGRYANWSGSSVLGRLVLILCMTNLSKHFIMIESVLWDGSRLDRTQVISLVPV